VLLQEPEDLSPFQITVISECFRKRENSGAMRADDGLGALMAGFQAAADQRQHGFIVQQQLPRPVRKVKQAELTEAVSCFDIQRDLSGFLEIGLLADAGTDRDLRRRKKDLFGGAARE